MAGNWACWRNGSKRGKDKGRSQWVCAPCVVQAQTCRAVSGSDHAEIWIIPALGGAERKLGESAACGLSWSPDGKYLAFCS
jgi:hypothetical protein